MCSNDEEAPVEVEKSVTKSESVVLETLPVEQCESPPHWVGSYVVSESYWHFDGDIRII